MLPPNVSPSSRPKQNKNSRQDSQQEKIDVALDPANIAKKKIKIEEDKKLPSEVQNKINLRAFELIVAEALPLSHVESVYFRNYSKEIDSRVTVMCTKSLKLSIAREFVKFKSEIRNEFELAAQVCLTADIWGTKRRSFMGVTAHWLKMCSDGTISRMSAAIAVLRFPGTFYHFMS